MFERKRKRPIPVNKDSDDESENVAPAKKKLKQSELPSTVLYDDGLGQTPYQPDSHVSFFIKKYSR